MDGEVNTLLVEGYARNESERAVHSWRASGENIQYRVSENRGPQYSTLNSRILIIRTPK